jgi:hypothetical protein
MAAVFALQLVSAILTTINNDIGRSLSLQYKEVPKLMPVT